MIPGGFGRPIPGTRGNLPGMGMYANAGNTPPASQPSFDGIMGSARPSQGSLMQMGQRTLTPEMAAQYRPQMMSAALMQGAPPGSVPQQLGNTGTWGYATPEQQAANAAPRPPAPQMGFAGAQQAMQPQMGIAQPTAAPVAPVATTRPTTAARGYAA
jgi:hypothetical protein